MSYQLGYPTVNLQVMCDKCGKPVERVSTSYYGHNDSYTFIVKCHGEWDRTVLPAKLFHEGWRITEARAFRQKEKTTVVIDVDAKGEAAVIHDIQHDVDVEPELPLMVGPPLESTVLESFEASPWDQWAPQLHTAL